MILSNFSSQIAFCIEAVMSVSCSVACLNLHDFSKAKIIEGWKWGTETILLGFLLCQRKSKFQTPYCAIETLLVFLVNIGGIKRKIGSSWTLFDFQFQSTAAFTSEFFKRMRIFGGSKTVIVEQRQHATHQILQY